MLSKLKIVKLFKPNITLGTPVSKIKKKLLNPKMILIIYTAAFSVLGYYTYQVYRQNLSSSLEIGSITDTKKGLETQLAETQKNYEDLKNEDQYVRNNTLEEEISNIQNTYKKAISVYEKLLDLKDKTLPAQAGKDTQAFDEALAEVFTLLSQRNYEDAANKLNTLSSDIDKKSQQIAASFKIPDNLTTSSTPPTSGYQRQKVQTESGTFMVDIISGDTGSTKVVVDTASDSDCGNDCPVLSLADYISRNNAYAGVNGSYFCPATYPSCAGKTNSFDLLVMNYKKTYFNSGNNIYSNNPAVIFGDGYTRFVSHASEWGRDTSPNGVLSNYPLLLLNSNITFSGDSDTKQSSKGGRSFVANKGSGVYIGIVFSATVAESAIVMKALGFENAMNLDDGGSTALWYGGYKAGPGRNIPNAILFLRK
ncbi:MAG: hypothetical protein UT39_C0011G0002 [Candidatus Woesebacteria bacterium GW2011_GWA1_39_21]|uniref:Phosphodiester glycosidase domain-containing protein n=1 Tax=Candidatus Woesebacteria bacterium GW2011_GWA1_39_21 TaxID=1618550 RepID=A0A0G0QL87_9BACT|nr:MAG: hypothetical protein UT39_C0011G0002 [Candidatus Woesebacteria bacterium GW2011_GWA1_39_21]